MSDHNIAQIKSNKNIVNFLEQIKELKSKHATMDEVIEFVSVSRKTKEIEFPLDSANANSLYNIIMPYQSTWQDQQEFLIRRFAHSQLQNYYTDRLIATLNCKDDDNIHPSIMHAFTANGMIITYGKTNILKLLSYFEKYLVKNCSRAGLTIIANHFPMGIEVVLEKTDTLLAKRIENIRNKIKHTRESNYDKDSIERLIKKLLLLFSNQFKLCIKV